MRKILVVDDEREIREEFTKMFQKEGFICVESEGGTDAWEKYQREGPFEAVLTDLFFHHELGDLLIHGGKLTQRILRMNPQQPIAIITGDTGYANRFLKKERIEGVIVLSKPVKPKILRDLVAKSPGV
jgi:DNA-binding NtrC family response regulator